MRTVPTKKYIYCGTQVRSVATTPGHHSIIIPLRMQQHFYYYSFVSSSILIIYCKMSIFLFWYMVFLFFVFPADTMMKGKVGEKVPYFILF